MTVNTNIGAHMLNFFKKKIAEEPQASLENRRAPLSGGDELLFDMLGMNRAAGVTVTHSTAMRCTAFLACVSLIAKTIATLPIELYELTQEGRNFITDHELLPLLQESPNEMMSAFIWKEMIGSHAVGTGRHLSVIERNRAGKVLGFIPVLPDRITPFRYEGKLYFKVVLEGEKDYEVFSDEDVIYVPGLGYDGLTGYNPVTLMRQSIGLSLATESHGSKLFENGTNLALALETDQKIDPDRQREILKLFNENFRGVDKANKTALLVDGLKAKPLTMTAEDAQFLETRKFQVTDIARAFGVPPHMIGDLEKSTFSNIEHQNINFVSYTLNPWLERIQCELKRKLFPNQPYKIEFNVDHLLRGDFQTRMEGLSKALNCGLITVNEGREQEGYNPVKGGNELRVPVNTQPIQQTS